MSVHTLSQRASFWVAAAVVCHTLWTSAAPAMTYPLYVSEWGLTPLTTTAIFAIYPVVVVGVLICFGDISGVIGRRAAILSGLAASLLGVLMFAVATDVAWVFTGRVAMGIGVGLSAGPATAAMIEFGAAGQSQRASSVTTASQAVGLGLATIVGGGLIQYAPFPTRLNFCVLFVVLATIFAAAWFLPRRDANLPVVRWTMKKLTIPNEARGVFGLSAIAVTTAYSLGALVLSLGAQIAKDLIGSGNVLINGAAIALFAVVWGITGVLARRLRFDNSMMLGGVAAVAGMGLLAVSATHHALPIFLASAALDGIGYSLLFMGGLGLLGDRVDPMHRTAALSALYLVAFLAMGLIALSLGAIATRWGLSVALDLGSACISVLGIATVLLAVSSRRTLMCHGPRRMAPAM